MSYAIALGSDTFTLADDIDITELKSEVVRNAHAGGGWVALDTASDGLIEVFVSAGQRITLQQRG